MWHQRWETSESQTVHQKTPPELLNFDLSVIGIGIFYEMMLLRVSENEKRLNKSRKASLFLLL